MTDKLVTHSLDGLVYTITLSRPAKRNAISDRLLDALNAVAGVRWIRLLYTHPAHYDDALIAAMTRNEKVVPYLDIPLQHIADPLLRAMHRRVTKAETVALLETLRERLPGLVLRTTFIVGFPGETEAMFQELLDFIEAFRFERVGAFAYSREPGTPAADLPDQVPDAVKRERVDRLMRRQQRIALEQHRARQHRRLEVLVEGPTDAAPRRGYPYAGRSYADAPDIDGQVFLRTPDQTPLQPGQFVTARIGHGYAYDLCGVVDASA
ncbi:MAG TPA: radical SAM protein [Armatimonadota bacterium]|nr:radical SAM protein [Armatimonadota bacterium]